MDLRRFNLNIPTATSYLDYQPFILSDTVQTGVAYSWVNLGDPRVSPQFTFYKDRSPLVWNAATEANARLRAMYEDMLDFVSQRFPGGSLLDVACNNGYFPVGAELRGMRGVGSDLGAQYGASIKFLNGVLGTKASFCHSPYDPYKHILPIYEKFDVVVVSAILCHMPDPLYFLKACADVAAKAILFWGQVVNTECKLIAYSSPHSNLSSITDFPHAFNDNTRLSRGMFKECAKLLGFSEFSTFGPNPTWPTPLHELVQGPLTDELESGSRHEVLLLVRG